MNLNNRPYDVMPFYVEIVDDNGNPVALPFPPYALSSGEPTDLVKFMTDQALSGKNPNEYAYAVKLLINPSTLSINMSKIINRTQTMTAWVEEHWGEELDTITFQGLTAAFVSGGSYTTYDAGKMAPAINAANTAGLDLAYPGLTNTEARRESISYRNLRDLVKIFGTNGIVYDDQGFVANRYFIQITYDYGCYRGYFESFDIVEESSNPFRYNYTVTFKAEKTVYRLATKNWPRPQPPVQEYGGGGIFNNLTSLLIPSAVLMDPVAEEIEEEKKPKTEPPKPKEPQKRPPETQPPVSKPYIEIVTTSGVERVAIPDYRNPDAQRSEQLRKNINLNTNQQLKTVSTKDFEAELAEQNRKSAAAKYSGSKGGSGKPWYKFW